MLDADRPHAAVANSRVGVGPLASTQRHASEEEEEEALRDAVPRTLAPRAAALDPSSGDRGREEEDAMRTYNVPEDNGASAARPSESSNHEGVRPLLVERRLLAAIAAPQEKPPADGRLSSSLGSSAPVANADLLPALDAMLSIDPNLALWGAPDEAESSPTTPPPPHDRRNDVLHHHVVIAASTGRKSDLVRCILRRVLGVVGPGERGATGLVAARDADGMRPIDVLTAQILMKEERLKYQRKRLRGPSRSERRRRTDDDGGVADDEEVALLASDLDDSWECARMIANVHAGAQHLDALPVVHACLLASSATVTEASATATNGPVAAVTAPVPRALLECSLRRFPQQLRQADSRGNVPLHYAAAAWRAPPPPKRDASTSPWGCVAADPDADDEVDEDLDDDDFDDDDDDVLPRILALHRGAARVRNGDGQYPVHVAIRAGRTWRTGVAELGAAHPEALLLDDDVSCFRALLPRFAALRCESRGDDDGLHRRQVAHIVYRLIRASPNALVP